MQHITQSIQLKCKAIWINNFTNEKQVIHVSDFVRLLFPLY